MSENTAKVLFIHSFTCLLRIFSESSCSLHWQASRWRKWMFFMSDSLNQWFGLFVKNTDSFRKHHCCGDVTVILLWFVWQNENRQSNWKYCVANVSYSLLTCCLLNFCIIIIPFVNTPAAHNYTLLSYEESVINDTDLFFYKPYIHEIYLISRRTQKVTITCN